MTSSQELALTEKQLNDPRLTSLGKPLTAISLDNIKSRKQIPLHKKNGNIVFVPLYTPEDNEISGQVIRNPGNGSSNNYPYRVRIQFVGRIEFHEVGKKGFSFVKEEKSLGKIISPNFPVSFKFENFPKPCETYNGAMASIKYYLSAILIDSDGNYIREDLELAIHLPTPPLANANMFNLQIGVMDVVEVDLEYKKTDFHLQECITGRVIIHLAQVEIKKIELYLIKLENYYKNSKSKMKEEVLKNIILKEGQPKKGDIIPLKLYLGTLDLSPTMYNVENVFNVKYFLTLGLIDANDRMFFRKVEINLRRG